MSQDLRKQLRTIISEVSEVDEIPDETLFKDLGIDSMMALEVVAEVERQYKLSVPEDERLAEVRTGKFWRPFGPVSASSVSFGVTPSLL